MTDSELTQAQLFDVFSNARRRQTVQYLKQRGRSCDLAPLVEQVAAWENDTDPDQVTRTERRRVYISLYQTHLPMLEDHGIVDWNAESHTIELLPNDDVFEPYLDRRIGTQRPWHHIYAAVSALGVATLAVGALSLGPATISLAPFVALSVCVTVLVVALIQRTTRRRGARFPFSKPRR